MDPKSGEILAMVGGKDYQESKFNRATQAYRQPGSTFKPFIYTTAIENGITAVDWYVDEPLQFPDGWKPKNYDKTFRGAIQIHEALEQSINIIAIKLLQQLGTDQVINYAKRMQVKSQLQKNLSLALGTSEVTLMELVNAYCAFANEGRIPEPYAITKIVDWEGNVIYSSNKTVRQAIPADTAYIMARLLQGVIEREQPDGQILVVRSVEKLVQPKILLTLCLLDLPPIWFVGFFWAMTTANPWEKQKLVELLQLQFLLK